jgi:hypothetical protein
MLGFIGGMFFGEVGVGEDGLRVGQRLVKGADKLFGAIWIFYFINDWDSINLSKCSKKWWKKDI